MSWSVYALRSRKDHALYIGMTSDVGRRVKKHKRGSNRSTRSRSAFDLIYVSQFESREQAREHEKFLKTTRGREILRGMDRS